MSYTTAARSNRLLLLDQSITYSERESNSTTHLPTHLPAHTGLLARLLPVIEAFFLCNAREVILAHKKKLREEAKAELMSPRERERQRQRERERARRGESIHPPTHPPTHPPIHPSHSPTHPPLPKQPPPQPLLLSRRYSQAGWRKASKAKEEEGEEEEEEERRRRRKRRR